MPRFKSVNGVRIQFTEEEERLRDAEEAEYALEVEKFRQMKEQKSLDMEAKKSRVKSNSTRLASQLKLSQQDMHDLRELLLGECVCNICALKEEGEDVELS